MKLILVLELEFNIMTTYRFNIQNVTLKEEMVQFSQYHIYEDKETIKSSFDDWIKSDHISKLVNEEYDFLKKKSYFFENNSTIQDKIFKSIKYYHMKKNCSKCNNNPLTYDNSSLKNVKVRNLKINNDIVNTVKKHLIENVNVKPSVSYDKFLETNADLIEREKMRFLNEKISEEKFYQIFKKMYKNLHYNEIKKCCI